MSTAIRALFLLAAAGLISFGLFIGSDVSDARWLVILFAAFLCLLVGTRIALPATMPTVNRGIIRIAMTIACVFMLISAQLVRIQVVQQEAMYYRTGIDPESGEVISNPRLYQRQLTVQRGRILDRNGVVLADTTLQDGIYYRSWPVESAWSVTGYYSPNRYGSTGIEATQEQALSGNAEMNPVESVFRDLFGQESVGNDVTLTIDSELQTQAYNALGPTNGAVVVLDIQTGETLVLVSKPTVNPNTLFVVNDTSAADAYWTQVTGDEAARPLVSRANLGLYTPGSTFKTVTAGIAIEEGIANPDSVYQDSGSLTIEGRTLVELNRPDETRNEWTLREGIMWSLNVVLAQVGMEIGSERYLEYGPRLGFGREIPYDVPVAQSQIASSPSFLDSQNAVADTGFGQGQILMSPLHLAMIASMWANDGRMMDPRLVAEIAHAEGSVITRAQPAVFLTCVSPGTADQVESMMESVISDGSAQHGQAPGYVMGGKTGTAELGDGTINSLFIGFIGDPNPRYAVAVVLEGGGVNQSPTVIGRDILVAAMERRATNDEGGN